MFMLHLKIIKKSLKLIIVIIFPTSEKLFWIKGYVVRFLSFLLEGGWRLRLKDAILFNYSFIILASAWVVFFRFFVVVKMLD